ncbi:DUF7427 family protein [Mycobacterium sp.]|jgi:hypothetical protein|uniref:DUF7427 family protein n=1 Tax=Mycobacterium sp. TaxID=1785 RepID=UPI002D6E23BC|nr:hypothetical protein [Mycobacterium sp.]HZA12361.1 hypothetical protein [Mycobacterium sp.]
MNAKQAWALLAAGVLTYEVSCRDGQLLSEGVDEWLMAKPVLTRAVIAALALHLGNVLPARYDIVSLGFLGLRRCSRIWQQSQGRYPAAEIAGQVACTSA